VHASYSRSPANTMQDERRRKEQFEADIKQGINNSRIQTHSSAPDFTTSQLSRHMIEREQDQDTDDEFDRTPKQLLPNRELESVSPASPAPYVAENSMHTYSPVACPGLIGPSSPGLEDPSTSGQDTSPTRPARRFRYDVLSSEFELPSPAGGPSRATAPLPPPSRQLRRRQAVNHTKPAALFEFPSSDHETPSPLSNKVVSAKTSFRTGSQSIVDMVYTVMVDYNDEADKDEASDDEAGDGDHKDTPAALVLGNTFTRALVPDECLFDPKATADDVLEGVEELWPLLAASQPCVKTMQKKIQDLPKRSPHFPTFVRDPETWSSVEPAIDQHRAELVRDEPVIDDPPKWLDMEESQFFKPFGSARQAVWVPRRTACGLDFISDEGSGKFGAHGVRYYQRPLKQFYPFTVLQVGISSACSAQFKPTTLRCVSTASEPYGDGSCASSSAYPIHLRKYWEDRSMDLLSKSKALVLILLGDSASEAYTRYTKHNSITSTVIPCSILPLLKTTRPVFSFESMRRASGEHTNTCFVLRIPYPELFVHYMSFVIGNDSRALAISERLID
jgi:hypothetical protein